jgi:NAD+ kinase
MPDSGKQPRIFVIGNPDKAGVQQAMSAVRSCAERHGEVVGCALGTDGRGAVASGAQFVVVLGGDGTLLAVSRSLGLDQIPLVGVNFGKLGFLAEFTVQEFEQHLGAILANGDLISERLILEVRVYRDGEECFASPAINDCVIQAGPPFRMISLCVHINGTRLVDITGDGVIVCTPVGSTAYNLSAGGPILEGGVLGIAVTPLCPHSLTHKPLVVEHQSQVDILVQQANDGTTVQVDGQVNAPLREGDRVTVKNSPAKLLLVRNPSYPRWHRLVTKLHWGQNPAYDAQSPSP